MLDATSREAMEASLVRMEATRPGAAGDELRAAIAAVREGYLSDAGHHGGLANAVPRIALHGYDADDLVRFYRRNVPAANPWPRGEAVIDHALRHRILALYEADADMLAMRRMRVEERYLTPPDRLPILDFVMWPPSSKVSLDADRARFMVKMRNDGQFPIYGLTVRVRITAPGRVLPVFDRAFKLTELATPIEPGATRQIAFGCCAVLEDPVGNNELKDIPAQARMDVSIVSATDYAKQELLDIEHYTLADARRERHLRHCMTVLSRLEPEAFASAGPCLSPTPMDEEPAPLADMSGHDTRPSATPDPSEQSGRLASSRG